MLYVQYKFCISFCDFFVITKLDSTLWKFWITQKKIKNKIKSPINQPLVTILSNW